MSLPTQQLTLALNHFSSPNPPTPTTSFHQMESLDQNLNIDYYLNHLNIDCYLICLYFILFPISFFIKTLTFHLHSLHYISALYHFNFSLYLPNLLYFTSLIFILCNLPIFPYTKKKIIT
jgi:hypothetical protein